MLAIEKWSFNRLTVQQTEVNDFKNINCRLFYLVESLNIDRMQNIGAKGAISHDEQFLHLPQCFINSHLLQICYREVKSYNNYT